MTARPQRSVVRSAYSAMARMRPRTVVNRRWDRELTGSSFRSHECWRSLKLELARASHAENILDGMMLMARLYDLWRGERLEPPAILITSTTEAYGQPRERSRLEYTQNLLSIHRVLPDIHSSMFNPETTLARALPPLAHDTLTHVSEKARNAVVL